MKTEILAVGAAITAIVLLIHRSRDRRRRSRGLGLCKNLTTPLNDGFIMPAEWEPHERTWMLWPVRNDIWRENAAPARAVYAAVALAIADFEPVLVGVPIDHYTISRAVLGDHPNITVFEISQDDSWARDTFPTFLRNHRTSNVRGVDWIFNGYGGLYSPCKDNLLAAKVLDLVGMERYVPDLILEPGSIHVDGEGTCLTTEECLLKRNNPMSKQYVEMKLEQYLGVKKLIWLKYGLVGDTDTGGHIDNLCCFVSPGRVALHWVDDPLDPQHARSVAALSLLEGAVDAQGRRISVCKVFGPPPMTYTEGEVNAISNAEGDEYACRHIGQVIPASYINFYICNSGVIIPGFGHPESDHRALKIITKLFPSRLVVQIQCRDVVLGGGGIHCITQQQPYGYSSRRAMQQGMMMTTLF